MSKFVTLHGFGGGTNSSDSIDLDQELNEQALLIQELEKTLKNKSIGDLNFEVVGGTTEPVDPVENTIWVNTDTEITSWVFSAIGPETLEEGMVWFFIRDFSNVSFNALKENNLQVYPISTKQYVNEAWVDVTAKSYQNNIWVEWWNGELFKDGEQYESITGGWTATGVKTGSSHTAATPSLSFSNGKMVMSLTKNGNLSGFVYCKNMIDTSKYNTLQIVVEGETGSGYVRIFTSFPTNMNDMTTNVAVEVGTMNVPLPTTSPVYIGFCVQTASGTNTMTISSVKMIE